METTKAAPSAAADLGEASELIEFPVAQGQSGEPFRMRITAPSFEDVLMVRKGLAPAVADKPDGAELSEPEEIERTEEALKSLERQMLELLEAGAKTEPPIYFDPKEFIEGGILWGRIHLRNRGAIVARITRLAGLGPTSVDRLGSFRDGGGDAPRTSGDGGVPASEVAG